MQIDYLQNNANLLFIYNKQQRHLFQQTLYQYWRTFNIKRQISYQHYHLINKVRVMNAYFHYRKSLDQARYKQLAQKLDHLLSNLHEDVNTEVRWIWELIQNAKDVSNQFGKTKILVTIDEKSMTFSHNGDPFRPSDLQSVVGQYSQKVEENNTETQTTGKYGTGFVTTYILSRRITIKGIQVVEDIQEDLDNQDIDSDHDEEKLVSSKSTNTLFSKNSHSQSIEHSASMLNFGINKQICSESKLGPLKMQSISNEFKQKLNKTQNQSEKNPEEAEQQQKDKKQDGNSQKSKNSKYVFQKFQIPLNRQYKNRQKDFPQTLRKNEFKIMKILYGLQSMDPWERTVDDFDTSFIYEKLDSTSFKMIATGINSLKQLFPYALCFNKKLYQIKVRDIRKIPEIADFTITKQNSQKLQNIDVSVCSITENEKTTKHYLAFKTDPKTRCTVAIPIDIGEKVRLLKINNKMPKAFKQFPLIGVKDTGYNFAFTSQNFYPNQTRSNLLLNKIEGRQNKKANQNWQALQSVMQLNISLTESLSTVVNLGQQNFIQVSQIPFMGNQHQTFKKYFGRYMKELIPNLKIVPYRNGVIGTLKGLVFIQDLSNHKQISDREASTQINQIFSFLFQTKETMTADFHQAWHKNINRNREYFNQLVKFKNIVFCLSKVSGLGLTGLQTNLGSQQAAINKLTQIYKMLQKYRPSLLNFNAPQNQFKIVLTKSYQLKCLKQEKISFVCTLKKKTNLPKVYEDLCKILKIDINSYLIHEDLAPFFSNTYAFSTNQANQRIQNYFQIPQLLNNTIKDYTSPDKFILLLRYLKTMKIGEKILPIIQQMDKYSTLQPFNVEMIQFKQLSNKQKDQYQACAQKIFLKKVNQMIPENSSALSLSKLLKECKGNITKTIQWYNKLLRMKYSSDLMKKNITWNELFRSNKSIKYMDPYPNRQDILFYDKIIQCINYRKRSIFLKQQEQRRKQARKNTWLNSAFEPRQFNQLLFLKAQLVHPESQPKYSQKVTYKHFFKTLTNQYSYLSSPDKIQFLDYVHKVHEKGNQQKMIYDDLAKIRHLQLMNMTNLTNNQIGCLYEFTKHKEIVPKLRELYQKFGIDKLMQIMQDHGDIKQDQCGK